MSTSRKLIVKLAKHRRSARKATSTEAAQEEPEPKPTERIVKDFTISSSKYCLLIYISTVFGILYNSVGLKPNYKY